LRLKIMVLRASNSGKTNQGGEAISKGLIATHAIAALAAPGFLPPAALEHPCTSRSQ
jgi:hypothetical protein